ncbi:MBL fold metallo-hydrolase [Halorussus halophilus]|uniref:MBL fold metallo-hydrolase n=1 Tax=Halorussus halophilus TaxID=2650975 RepID=UPI0013017EDE|nr:MBL fold metallo-hydrolase [Halorussus halophilus]
MNDDDTASVSPAALYERIEADERTTLLDVRNRDEFESWRIEGPDAVQVPYSEFVAAKARGEVDDLLADLDLREPVVTVCPRGEASEMVAELLRERGVEAENLEGGMEGWARLYVTDEVPAMGATVTQYDRPATGCLSYLVVAGDEAAVIDPLRAFADRYVADAENAGAELKYAIDTHVHADHLSGVRAVADESGAEPVLPAGAPDRGLAFDATLLADEARLEVGEKELTAVHAPGHTTELTVLRLDEILFSGDALFLDSFGRPDLQSGDEGARDLAATTYDTLRGRLLSLPDESLVAPGHRTPTAEPAEDGTYTARLAEVRQKISLPDDREAFVSRVVESLPPRPANFEAIVPTNLGTQDVDDETAFELELGPNNCAVAAE